MPKLSNIDQKLEMQQGNHDVCPLCRRRIQVGQYYESFKGGAVNVHRPCWNQAAEDTRREIEFDLPSV